MPKTKLARKWTTGTAHSSGNHQILISSPMPGPAGDRVFTWELPLRDATNSQQPSGFAGRTVFPLVVARLS
jgi:hypothetical protein